MMDELHLLRLYRLADMLENFNTQKVNLRIPGDGHITKFNMTTWGCDTAACALGSAALLPMFRAAGLQTQKSGVEEDGYGNRHETRHVVFNNPKNGIYKDISEEAGALFFGITQDEASMLFLQMYEDKPNGGTRRARPITVAKKVRALIAKYEEELYGSKDATPAVPSATR